MKGVSTELFHESFVLCTFLSVCTKHMYYVLSNRYLLMWITGVKVLSELVISGKVDTRYSSLLPRHWEV